MANVDSATGRYLGRAEMTFRTTVQKLKGTEIEGKEADMMRLAGVCI